MNIALAVNLSSRAWCLPILTHMQDGVPGRQAQLIAACAAPRNSFGQSLSHLFEMKLLERTPGHGHPLRPEFRLTKTGGAVAAEAAQIWHVFPEEQRKLLQKTWILPLVLVAQSPVTNKALKTALAPITDRALSLALKRLETAGLMQRSIAPDARPARPVYHATVACPV